METKGKFVHGMLLPDDFDVEGCKKEILKQSKRAIKAIVDHESDSGKKKLFEDDAAGIQIRFGLKRLRLEGNFHRAPVQFRHPERLIENTSICLILPDFDHKKADRHDPDVDKHARRWADIIRSKHELTGKEITKICTFIQLKRELLDVKDKERFVNSYDIIFIQKNIHISVVQFLGRPCFKSKRYPFRIDTESPNFRETILTANSFSNLVCEPNQVHVQIRFGNVQQSKADLYENLEDVVEKAANYLPGGLFNVQVVRMQTENGPALPVYVDFGTADDVIVEPKEPEEEPIIDDCSTLPEGLKIGVKPGRISRNTVFLVDENA